MTLTDRRRPHRVRMRKKFVASYDGYEVYAVDASAIRCIAQPDEEFANFATRKEFPDLIPAGEIWIGDKTFEAEGVFFIANALARLNEEERGVSEEKAYTKGIEAERMLRENLTGFKFRDGKAHRRVPNEVYFEHYITLPDPQGAIDVWLVDGNVVRSLYKTDYTEGGHGYVYPWVPKQQIWIEKDVDRWEYPFLISHEYLELRLMRDEGIDYDTAHGMAAKLEFHLRKRQGLHPLLVAGRRRLGKRDLPRLTRGEVIEYVVKRCHKK